MTNSQANVCRVIQEVGKFAGRIKLQKTVYIAQRLGYPFLESFSWSKFGPFSRELAAEVDELKELHILHEEPTKEWGYKSYKYRLTEEGKRFLALVEEREPASSMFRHLISELHTKRTARELELIASILYYEELGDDRETAVREVVEAKPKYRRTPEQILQALNDLKVLANHFRATEESSV